MLLVTACGSDSHYSEHGINCIMETILLPINHSMMWYPGLDVLPPFIIYGVNSMKENGYDEIANK